MCVSKYICLAYIQQQLKQQQQQLQQTVAIAVMHLACEHINCTWIAFVVALATCCKRASSEIAALMTATATATVWQQLHFCQCSCECKQSEERKFMGHGLFDGFVDLRHMWYI